MERLVSELEIGVTGDAARGALSWLNSRGVLGETPELRLSKAPSLKHTEATSTTLT